MIRRYTAKEREEAAVFCSIMAADRHGHRVMSGILDRSLASKAFNAVPHVTIESGSDLYPSTGRRWAEAESWLRSGWSPGDTWTDEDRRRAGLP